MAVDKISERIIDDEITRDSELAAVAASIPTMLSELGTDANNRLYSDDEKAKVTANTAKISLTDGSVTNAKLHAEVESRIAGSEISGGGATQSPGATLDMSNNLSTITMSADLVVTSITNMPVGGSIRRYIHEGYNLTVLGVTDFIDKDGENHVKIINYGTLGTPILRVFDAVGGGSSLDTSGMLTDTLYGFRNGGLVPIPGDSAPDAPSITTSIVGDDISIAITAGAYNGGQAVTGWHIQKSPNGTDTWTDQVADTGNTTTPYVVVAPGGGSFYYKVASINSIGESAWSNVDGETIIAPAYDTTTLGTTVALDVSTSTNAAKRGFKVYPAADGFIDSVTFRHSNATGNALIGIYADSSNAPGALIGVSISESAITTGQEWTTHALTTPLAITKGTPVWIAMKTSVTATWGYLAAYGRSVFGPTDYDMADPFGTITTDSVFIYPSYANVRYLDTTYNYLVNDNFTDWASASVPDGWTLVGTPDGSNYVEENANGIRFVCSASSSFSIKRVGAFASGTPCVMELDLYSVTANGVTLQSGASGHGSFAKAGKMLIHATTTGVDLLIKTSSAAATDVIIRGIKIWE